jgi:hypothetical protein
VGLTKDGVLFSFIHHQEGPDIYIGHQKPWNIGYKMNEMACTIIKMDWYQRMVAD